MEKISRSSNFILEFNCDHKPISGCNDDVHVYGVNSNVCLTDSKGYSTPKNQSPFDLVLHASEGFVPLWEQGTVLRWRFNKLSLMQLKDPDSAKNEITQLFAAAIMAWGDAAPVKFAEVEDAWDFEIVIRKNNECSYGGCTLASAFFPDSGRHELVIYPKLFDQSDKEKIETLVHELGHVFGLRHFFAKVQEVKWPSEIYGEHSEHQPFTIMNYGAYSELTEVDKSDLKSLYSLFWNGNLKDINGTKIVKVRPYHLLG